MDRKREAAQSVRDRRPRWLVKATKATGTMESVVEMEAVGGTCRRIKLRPAIVRSTPDRGVIESARRARRGSRSAKSLSRALIARRDTDTGAAGPKVQEDDTEGPSSWLCSQAHKSTPGGSGSNGARNIRQVERGRSGEEVKGMGKSPAGWGGRKSGQNGWEAERARYWTQPATLQNKSSMVGLHKYWAKRGAGSRRGGAREVAKQRRRQRAQGQFLGDEARGGGVECINDAWSKLQSSSPSGSAFVLGATPGGTREQKDNAGLLMDIRAMEQVCRCGER
ncbi:hypothetical protein B0H13DRAFT_1885151 [Mycena leptocephala]|nr:hypothetical protein B0H13DRAFT_1885151 [Mycena leptocephala]